MPNQSPILPPPNASCCCLRLRASCSARPRTYSISSNRATRLSLAIVALNIIAFYYAGILDVRSNDLRESCLCPFKMYRRNTILKRISFIYLFIYLFIFFYREINWKIKGTFACSRFAQLFQRSPSVVVADGLKKKKRFTPYYDQFPSYRWHHSHGTFSPPLAVNYSVYKRRT